MLNKSSGNMYSWISHTWNPIKGECPHDCVYCYMKRFPQPELHLDNKALTDNLGAGNVIFVGSSTDMWADKVSCAWISIVLNRCRQFDNTYLFQSKNPARFAAFILPKEAIIGTTIETNRVYPEFMGKAPNTLHRKIIMANRELRKMVSIEPIMDFHLETMVSWMQEIKPEFISIGADSKRHNLPEPSPEKVQALITELQKITKVKIKDNLKRLMELRCNQG